MTINEESEQAASLYAALATLHFCVCAGVFHRDVCPLRIVYFVGRVRHHAAQHGLFIRISIRE